MKFILKRSQSQDLVANASETQDPEASQTQDLAPYATSILQMAGPKSRTIEGHLNGSAEAQERVAFKKKNSVASLNVSGVGVLPSENDKTRSLSFHTSNHDSLANVSTDDRSSATPWTTATLGQLSLRRADESDDNRDEINDDSKGSDDDSDEYLISKKGRSPYKRALSPDTSVSIEGSKPVKSQYCSSNQLVNDLTLQEKSK